MEYVEPATAQRQADTLTWRRVRAPRQPLVLKASAPPFVLLSGVSLTQWRTGRGARRSKSCAEEAVDTYGRE